MMLTIDHGDQERAESRRLAKVRSELEKIEAKSEAPASGKLNLFQPTLTNTFSDDLNSNSYYIQHASPEERSKVRAEKSQAYDLDVGSANADFDTFKLDSFLRAKQYAQKKISLLYEFSEVEAALLSWDQVDESLK